MPGPLPPHHVSLSSSPSSLYSSPAETPLSDFIPLSPPDHTTKSQRAKNLAVSVRVRESRRCGKRSWWVPGRGPCVPQGRDYCVLKDEDCPVWSPSVGRWTKAEGSGTLAWSTWDPDTWGLRQSVRYKGKETEMNEQRSPRGPELWGIHTAHSAQKLF
uniref:Uncharacterized protein n=1 Tax=Knipowitschia caucasica TaxID=637954 RepID=A0AAV2LNN9_KNICA